MCICMYVCAHVPSHMWRSQTLFHLRRDLLLFAAVWVVGTPAYSAQETWGGSFLLSFTFISLCLASKAYGSFNSRILSCRPSGQPGEMARA